MTMIKTILVTGASSGFGAAICRDLIAEGYRVVGAARRLDKLEALHQQLGDDFIPVQMDVTDKTSVNQALRAINEEGIIFDGLINNAGLGLGLDKAHEVDFADWETMIMTNVLGLTYLTRQLLPQLVTQKGYIINMGSTAGNYPYPGGNVYGATKAFVKQFSLNLRADLSGTGVRVTNIEPGMVEGTEFSNIRFKGDDDRARKLYEGAHCLTPDDISRTVVWLLEQPPHMNINRIELMPTTQSFGNFQVVYDGD